MRDLCAGGGVVYTWGWGENGQLGHGDAARVLSPQRVASLRRVVSIVAGHEHALAVTGVCMCVRTCVTTVQRTAVCTRGAKASLADSV